MNIDYIGWGIGVLGCIIGIGGIVRSRKAAAKNVQLENQKQQVNNSAGTIIQNIYFNNLPQEMKEQINFIYSTTSSALSMDSKPLDATKKEK